MAVFTEESVKANIRNLNGKRVFCLAEGNHLTPSAREWLRKERIDVVSELPVSKTDYQTPDGIKLTEKPEHMTHLRSGILVSKLHPRIRFRGAVDGLEAAILRVGFLALEQADHTTVKALNELLDAVRMLIRCDVLEEPVQTIMLCGETLEQLREKSHHPEAYYGQPHFMPGFTDPRLLLELNVLRTRIRETELLACDAFTDRDGALQRKDIVLLLNRMSSLIWILMIRMKKGEKRNGQD